MLPSNGNHRPCDWWFDIDQTPSNEMTATCPYNIVRDGITCIKQIEDSASVGSTHIKEIATAAPAKHLQAYTHQKLMRQGTSDVVTEGKIPGDKLIGEIILRKIFLIPMLIDPHGKWGPMFDLFLFNVRPPEPIKFWAN